MRANDICQGCEHAYSNNSDKYRIGCRAFPEGIFFGGVVELPDIGSPHSHDKPYKDAVIINGKVVFEGQKNDYVYMPTKREFSRTGRKITIYQDSNPYADENGRYNGK